MLGTVNRGAIKASTPKVVATNTADYTDLCPARAEFKFHAVDSSKNITIRKQEIFI